MKKVLKVVGIITGIYLVLDVLRLAFIGWTEYMSHLKESGYKVFDAIDIAWDNAIEKLKQTWT